MRSKVIREPASGAVGGCLEDSEMSGTWTVRMLAAMTGRSLAKPDEVELEPIEPGAWAAWAEERGLRTPRATDAMPGGAGAPARLSWTSATGRRFVHR